MASAGTVVIVLLVVIPAVLLLIAGIALLVYGVRRQRRDREAFLASREHGTLATQEAARPGSASLSPDNVGLMWAIVGGVLLFFALLALGFVVLTGVLAAL